MKIEELLIQSKTGDMGTCEDAYVCNEHFAVVIDGATSVSGRLYDGKTQGQLAAETIKEAIFSLDGQEGINEIIEIINDKYSHLYEKIGIKDEVVEKPYLCPSASLIIFSKHHRKVWMVGDCQCYFGGHLYQNIKHIDVVFAEVRSILLQGELLRGKTQEELLKDDIGFQLIRPLIRKQYNFQNTDPNNPISYAVINGFPIPEQLIKTVEVPEHVEQIILASDGYPKVFGTLEETEYYLKEILKADPLCFRENMATKGLVEGNASFDDRTYLRVWVD